MQERKEALTKDEARKYVLGLRDSLLDEDINTKSRAIFEKVTALLPYKEAENILIYVSMRSEVKTDEIILDALSSGKRVFCPKVTDKKRGIMTFVCISSLEDLKEGYFGIREPELVSGYEEPFFDHKKSFMIMPLIAFDKGRNRIGYSGGFYDRYLEKNRKLKTCAIAFECQLVGDGIDADDHDIAPSMVITEESI